MDAWVRNLIVLVVMAVWATYILVSIVRRDPIDSIVWGLPGAVYFALNPTFRRPQAKKPNDKDSTE